MATELTLLNSTEVEGGVSAPFTLNPGRLTRPEPVPGLSQIGVYWYGDPTLPADTYTDSISFEIKAR